jgi:hypothetical protein
MRKLPKKSKAIIAGAIIVGLGTSGVAYSYWTNVTTTTVSGTVGANGNTLTLSTAGSLPTSPGATGTITVSAHNATQASQKLTALSGSVSAPGCTIQDFTITDHTTPGTVLPGPTVPQGTFDVTLNNLGVNQDACQGAAMTFTVSGL